MVCPALIYRDWLIVLQRDWRVASLERSCKRFKRSEYDLNQITVKVTLRNLKKKVPYLLKIIFL